MGKRIFTCNENGSDKFWSIEVLLDDVNKKYAFTVHYGKVGTAGQAKEKEFSSKEECNKEADSLIAQKIKKGYIEGGSVSVSAPAAKSTAVKAKEKNADENESPEEIFQKAREIYSKDNKKGFALFEKAEQKGHAEAALWMGYAYNSGRGVKENDEKALEYFVKAAEKGNETAVFRAARSFYQLRRRLTKEMLLMVEKIENDPKYQMGWFCCNNSFMGSYEEALVWYNDRLAKNPKNWTLAKSESEYYNTVGMEYENKINDEVKAYKYYKMAADIIDSTGSGQYNLARFCAKGQACEKDLDKAIELYKGAIEKGFLHAINNIGCVYEEKGEYQKAYEIWLEGLEKTPENAVYLYCNIGELYENGNYFEQDYSKALDCFVKSYESNKNFNYIKKCIDRISEKTGVTAADIVAKAEQQEREAAEEAARIKREKEEAQRLEKEKANARKKELSKKLKAVFDEFERKTSLPSLVLKAKNKKEIAVTDSKLGGLPYVPKGFKYPHDNEGKPLRMLAQINFSQFPQLPDFPKDGILQFYISGDDLYGMNDTNLTEQDTFRMVYHKTIETELSDFVPKFDDEDYLPFDGELLLTAAEKACALTSTDYRFEDEFIEIYKKHMPVDGKLDSIYDLPDEESELIHEKYCENGHRMGGYPFFTQQDPRGEGDNHNILLLQIDSEDDVMWGDCGVGNFFISREKLLALDFSDVIYTWDCF